MSLTVKDIVEVTSLVGAGDTAVVGREKALTFVGFGIRSGDLVRWVASDVESSQDCATAPPVGSPGKMARQRSETWRKRG